MMRTILLTTLLLASFVGSALAQDPSMDRRDAIHESLLCRGSVPPGPARAGAGRAEIAAPCIDPRGSGIHTVEVRWVERGSDKLDPRSDPILEGLARFIVAEPDLALIEIGVHLMQREVPALGYELSQRRAQAVYDALTRLGAPRERLFPKGRATSQPLVPFNGPRRHLNERVEFTIILLRGETTTWVEPGRCKECPFTGACAPEAEHKWTCRAPSAEECRASEECASRGRCAVVAMGCGAGSDLDCEMSRACAERGDCTLVRGLCRPGSDAQCSLAAACRDFGECRWDGRRCAP